MALRVEEQVAGFEVSVEETGGVHVLQTFKHLVDDILLVDVFQDVGSDNCMKVCVHEVEHEVDVFVILCSDHVLQSNDIFMAG